MLNIQGYGKCDRVFRYFEEISKIPHTSGNTAPIAEYLVDFAKAHGLECLRDKADNVIIKKPATPGYENKPGIILQGHTDMVAAVRSDKKIDLEKECITLIHEGDFLFANGTTLGADDGVFMAYALAILDSEDIDHPSLEALFTSDEETGLIGATELSGDMLSGKIMINIDSDIEGTFTVACAGGMRVDVTLPYTQGEENDGLYIVSVTGLHGGHSGMEIDKGRENAIKILGEVINGSCIAEISGGNADNAIPRYAVAIIKPESKEDLESNVIPGIIAKYKNSEPAIEITIEESGAKLPLYSSEDSAKILEALAKTPTGVYKMSEEIADLPETSSNLGIISMDGGRVTLSTSIRSSKNSEKLAIRDKIRTLANEYDAEFSERGEYPAWEYKKDSPLRDKMVRLYEDMYKKSPVVLIIHAGLECGIFSGKIEGLDCVSIGPDMFDIHTTEERLSIPSCARVFDYLLALLKKI